MSADKRSDAAIGHEQVCAKAEAYANNCIHEEGDRGERRVLPATALWPSLGS